MSETLLIWNKRGRVSVQMRGDRVFDSAGRIIGWVRGENVYDTGGRHVGWFIGGILRDVYGRVLGFSKHLSAGQPHPELPRNLEGAPTSSLEGGRGKPGLQGAPGKPLLGGKPPLGSSWSEFDPQEYFERR